MMQAVQIAPEQIVQEQRNMQTVRGGKNDAAADGDASFLSALESAQNSGEAAGTDAAVPVPVEESSAAEALPLLSVSPENPETLLFTEKTAIAENPLSAEPGPDTAAFFDIIDTAEETASAASVEELSAVPPAEPEIIGGTAAAAELQAAKQNHITLKKGGEVPAEKEIILPEKKKTAKTEKAQEDTAAAPLFTFAGTSPALKTSAVGAEDTGVKTASKRHSAEKAVIEVLDERTVVPAEKTVEGVVFKEDGSAEMTLMLADRKPESDIQEAGRQNGETRSSFASLLSDELQNRSGDLVKTGSIILRDNNTGLIWLTVHPETLGNVKIQLELADKVITGKIIVSSEEAFNVFRENMQGLRDAFTAGGFENAGFELSWSGSESNNRGNQENPRAPFYAALVSPAGAEDSGEAENAYYSRSAVNMMA